MNDDHQQAGHGGAPESPAREPVFNLHRAVLAAIALCAIIHAARAFALPPSADMGLIVRFAFIPVRWSGQYAPDIYTVTSGVTYSLLHGSLAHLLINMVWLAAFGTPLANRVGSARFVAFWVVTALISAAFFFVLHTSSFIPMVGASGVISALMGAAARFGFATSRHGRNRQFAGPVRPVAAAFSNRTVIAFVSIWFIVNFLAGSGLFGLAGDNPIAWEAHIGGFVAGFFLIGLFDPAIQRGK